MLIVKINSYYPRKVKVLDGLGKQGHQRLSLGPPDAWHPGVSGFQTEGPGSQGAGAHFRHR